MTGQETEQCTACGGPIIVLSLPSPWGTATTVRGTCPQCEKRIQREAVSARAAAQRQDWLAECGCDEPTVYPSIRQHVQQALDVPEEPGVIWVYGEMCSGRSTVAATWVRRSIVEHGARALYVDVSALARMPAQEASSLISRAADCPRIAIDGLGQSPQPLALWQVSRLVDLVTGRGNRWTLVTSPYIPDTAGRLRLGALVGDEVPTRLAIMLRSGIKLPPPAAPRGVL